ncbi:hypothetical protein [Hymenobacter mucosus]|uniref:Uncharacterized protein n=1 Tax=Hymenobacter mucosus TaxID=1411120 RepID=A0A239AB23_9BACT|nr:hypothetical protein [Hymenobacter mucosus]SNR92258.1 hypothetical protein SAMN06269173_11187 [Hymenobacter mucosus]
MNDYTAIANRLGSIAPHMLDKNHPLRLVLHHTPAYRTVYFFDETGELDYAEQELTLSLDQLHAHDFVVEGPAVLCPHIVSFAINTSIDGQKISCRTRVSREFLQQTHNVYIKEWISKRVLQDIYDLKERHP